MKIETDEQFQAYKNAMQEEKKRLEEQFKAYKEVCKNEKKVTRRISVSLDQDLVNRIKADKRGLGEIISSALAVWQGGEQVPRKKVKIKITLSAEEEEKLHSVNYSSISSYLNDILSSYYSRR